MIKNAGMHVVNANVDGDRQAGPSVSGPGISQGLWRREAQAVPHVASLNKDADDETLFRCSTFCLFVLLIWSDGSKHTVNKANIIWMQTAMTFSAANEDKVVSLLSSDSWGSCKTLLRIK